MPNEAHRKKRSSDRQSNRGATYTCALRPFEIIQNDTDLDRSP